MKNVRALFSILVLTAVLGSTGFTAIAFAQQASSVSVAAEALPASGEKVVSPESPKDVVPALVMGTDTADKEPSIGEVIQGLVKVFDDWKKLGWQAGLAALLMCLVSTLKNSMLRQMIWAKIPTWARITVAPALAIAAFGLSLGKDFTMAAFWAALTTGVAAVYMHEFLDGLKTAPFIGEKWAWAVEAVGKLFGKKLTPAEQELKEAKIKAAAESKA